MRRSTRTSGDRMCLDIPAISSAAPARTRSSQATRVGPPPRQSSSQPELESDNLSEDLLVTAVPFSRGSSLSKVAPPPWLQQELPASRNGSSPARGRSGSLTCRLGGTTSEQLLGDKATEQRTRANSTRHDTFAPMSWSFPSEELRLQIRRNDLRTGLRTSRPAVLDLRSRRTRCRPCFPARPRLKATVLN